MAFRSSTRPNAEAASVEAGGSDADWRRVAASLDARLSEVENLLARRQEAMFLWDGSGTERRIGGASSRDVSLATFLSDLVAADQTRAEDAVARLLETGKPFRIQARTRGGGAIDCEGATAGGAAAIWVRDVSAMQAKIGELRLALDSAEREVQQLRQALDAAPLPIWLRAADKRLSWANRYYAAAVDAGSWVEAVERNDELVPASAPAQIGQMHRRRVVMNAEPRALDVLEVAVSDGTVGFGLDATSAEQARTEFNRFVEGQHALFDSLGTAVAVFDPERHLSFFNPAFADLTRLSARWLEEQPHHSEILDAMRAQRRLPEEIDFRGWKNRVLELHRTLREPLSEMWHLVDGATLHVMAHPHPAGGLIFVYEDVTDRLALEQSYNALIGVQRETLDNLFEGVALFGPGGRLELFNPAFAVLWDLDRESLADRPHVDQVCDACAVLHADPEFWARIKDAVAGVRAVRAPLSGRIERADDKVIEFTGVPLPDGATLLTWLDVTDSIQIQRALRERTDALETADRLKGAFISHVSYQLRTPLNAIIGFGEILEHEYFGSLTDRQHEYTRGILEASEELMRLIEDMLDLATIEAGTFQLEFEVVDIRSFLERSIARARERLGEDLSIMVECPPDVGAMRADERRMRRVMRHLIANAVQASRPDEVLTMGAERDAEEVRIWLQDRGSGIAPEDRDAIFAKFESRQADTTHRGAGLGLTLVRSLVELHGGRVDLDSEPGVGTRVTCHLPQGANPVGAIA